MLKNPIEDKVNEWAKSDPEYRDINLKIIHLEKRLFSDYLPCLPPEPDFFYRLKKWIENANIEDDKKLLFQLIPQLFFVGEEEFNSLYRTAYNVEVAKWLIDRVGIDFHIADIQTTLREAAKNTWFCATTDSFRINDFFKINSIPSQFDIRPDWHSLTELGDITNIDNYISVNNIERIVLLEDFVGSGSQVKSHIEFICKNFPRIKLLFISLITCPKGILNFSGLEATYPNLAVKHIIEIPDELFIAEIKSADESSLFTSLREMATRLYSKTTNGIIPGVLKPYYPLGYKKTGALIVLYTNTPDNTLPMIHWESLTWYPLFKRITRL